MVGEILLGLTLVFIHLAITIWAAMDSKKRGYSTGRIVLIFFMVLLIPVLGVILYLILRPAGKLVPCPKCGKNCLPTLRKCPNCGYSKKPKAAAPVRPIPPPPGQASTPLKVKCPHCGQIVEQSWKTCPYCSRKILIDTTIIDEVFLMYKDGRLIKHFTRRLKPDIDQDILSGMLTAVQSFIKDSFRGETGDLDHMKFGRFQILVGHGRFITVAAVTMGDEVAPFRPQIVKAIDQIEKDYELLLRDWDGEVEHLNVLGRYILDLIDGRYA
ncbi:MAG: zinc ribbon domain-containing protein [Thermoplasmata archaeon]